MKARNGTLLIHHRFSVVFPLFFPFSKDAASMATGEAPGTIGDFLAFLQPSSNAVELEIREPIDALISDVPGIPRLPGIPISEVK